MKKTSVYLDDELDRALARRAAEEGLSKAELIRRTLAGVVARPSRPKPHIAVFDSGSARAHGSAGRARPPVSVAVDSSLVLALYDSGDAHHADGRRLDPRRRRRARHDAAGPRRDRRADRRLAPDARAALFDDFERGALVLRWWADALAESIEIARERPGLGLADASLVALAARLRTQAIATFDHDHFRPLTGADGGAFVLLPADAT